jgi:thiol:disulfide interchange protein
VVAALSELAGIKKEDIEVFLEQDAFTVAYDASQVTLEQMYQSIRDLGYASGLEAIEGNPAPSDTKSEVSPILAALGQAAGEAKLVLVDFSAEWCAACKMLEAQVLSNSAVIAAMQNYVFVRVDTDEFPREAGDYDVIGMPTLLILNSGGEELFRSVGMVEAESFRDKLNELATK